MAKQPTETQDEYRQRIMDIVCTITASTEKGIHRIIEAAKKDDPEFPAERTIRGWMIENEAFAAQYARAKEDQVEKLVDQIIEISDDDSLDIAFTEDGKQYVDQQHIQRSKLRVDSRKWIASKLKPKKYGDKIEQTLQNPDGSALTINIVKFSDAE